MLIDFFDSIPPLLYSTIYYVVLMILCLIIVFLYSSSFNNEKVLRSSSISKIIAVILSVFVIVFIGLRPVSGIAFIDMYLYNHSYVNILQDYVPIDFHEEWLWDNFSYFCKDIGLSNRDYFLVIDAIYFGLMLVACWRLMRNNLLLAVLFCFVSFSCFTYGVNGLRNGMACSILMLAITFLKKYNILELGIALLLIIISVSIHRSTMLPAVCAIAAYVFIKKPEYAIAFWVLSILISLVVGNYVAEFFSNIGFDDRMSQYANLDEMGDINNNVEYNVGFRWDFLIYSMMPIIMVWYVTVKRNFKDKMYNIIAITYILSNAFWVMVIRSNQSNRFAYLSWFLYPLVIAYPLIRMNIWEDQDRKTGLILLAYSGFTFFMQFIYYGR